MSTEEESVESTTTIKAGAGYDAPWFKASGHVEEQRQQIAEAFGVAKGSDTDPRTLAEMAIEASLIWHALVNAATIGAKPKAAPAKKAEPAKTAQAKPAAKKSIAAKAKDKGEKIEDIAKSAVEDEISNAKTAGELTEIYKKNKSEWTPELTKLAAARKEEIK